MRTAKPLTPREKAQLDTWNERLDARAGRGYLIGGLGGFAAGAALTGWMIRTSLAQGGTSTLSASAPFMAPVEAAVGSMAAGALFGGVLFGAAMFLVSWRVVRAQRAMRDHLRVRYLAAGAEGEAGRDGA